MTTKVRMIAAVCLFFWAAVVGSAQMPGRGVENQRKADLGNGTYLNPIFAGDHPDPSILKDGDDYYMTHSSFDSYPGLLIWHSKDLVNWEPVGPALRKNVGSVWAPDLAKHKGRYYVYFPGWRPAGKTSNFVVWADDIRGPWSDPIDLGIGGIDPGHAVGPDGKRYLVMSGGGLVPLADDGLSVTGPVKKVYDGWKYPEDWIVESFSLEGPKVMKHGEFYYMIVAEGGTAGPPTSHMAVVSRSKSLDGPWENSPYNPLIHTRSRDEKWWSKGHATLVEGPGGKWYVVYHAYQNGFYTLGRQTLLEPVEWTKDGWLKSSGFDVSKPIPKPKAPGVPNGSAFSDDFSTNKMGVQWSFYKGGAGEAARYRYESGALILTAKGETPRDSSPLSFVVGDEAYQAEVEIEVGPESTGGLILFYNDRLYAGLGFGGDRLIQHRYGLERTRVRNGGGNRLFVRLVNDRLTLLIYTSVDGLKWERWPTAIDVSGYHHNTGGDFLSLRPALYAAGKGEVTFRNFKYRALP